MLLPPTSKQRSRRVFNLPHIVISLPLFNCSLRAIDFYSLVENDLRSYYLTPLNPSPLPLRSPFTVIGRKPSPNMTPKSPITPTNSLSTLTARVSMERLVRRQSSLTSEE